MAQETPKPANVSTAPVDASAATSDADVAATSELAGLDGADSERARATGPQIISGYLKTLPSAPGVYRMLNTDGEVIYVGKARSLKAACPTMPASAATPIVSPG